VTYAHITNQAEHMTGMKYIADLPITLAQIQLVTVANHYSSGVLPPVLEHQ
jgi:hypothetical protein